MASADIDRHSEAWWATPSAPSFGSLAGSSSATAHEQASSTTTIALPAGPYPSASEYVSALQSPAEALTPAELRTATPRKGMFDLPAVTTGQNAAVFMMDLAHAGAIALRAFTSRPSRGPEVYTALARTSLPDCMTSVDWFDDGLIVNGARWPAVTMPWVDGLTLERWLDAHRHDRDRVQRVRQNLRAAVDDLQGRGISHGDLQHGNIIVSDDDRVTLVDYDGVMLFDPSTGTPLMSPPSEAGHPNYQHPERITRGDCSQHADTFSAVLLDLSLAAIGNSPSLYRNDDNSLVLTAEDLEDPAGRGSHRFAQLIDALDTGDQETGEKLQRWCTRTHELALTRSEFETRDVLPDLSARSSPVTAKRTPVDSFYDSAKTAFSAGNGAGAATPPTGRTSAGGYRGIWVVWGIAVVAILAFIVASELEWSSGSTDESAAAANPRSQSGGGEEGDRSSGTTEDRPRSQPALEWGVGSCVRLDRNEGELVPCERQHDAVVVQQTISQQCPAYYWPQEGITSSFWFDSDGTSRVWCVAPQRNARVMEYRIGACLRDTGDGLVPVPCSTWHDFRIDDRVSDPYWCPEYYLEDGLHYFCLGT